MNSTVTELLLQRWVDGQVTNEEERELLADCDRHPGQWRRVALAFIEDRAISREFADHFQQAYGAKMEKPAPASKPAASAQPTLGAASWLASNRVQQWCAVAASLLLGVFVGNFFDWRLPDSNRQISQQDDRPNQRNVRPLEDASMVEYIPDQSRGERYQMPLLDARTAPAGYFENQVELTGMPPEFQELLRRHGIEIHGRRDWKSYEIEEGQVIVIPTLHLDIRQQPTP